MSSPTEIKVMGSAAIKEAYLELAPQFAPNQTQLRSAQTYFADAYKLLNSKGVFPNIANALGLTTAERAVDIVREFSFSLPDHRTGVDKRGGEAPLGDTPLPMDAAIMIFKVAPTDGRSRYNRDPTSPPGPASA